MSFSMSSFKTACKNSSPLTSLTVSYNKVLVQQSRVVHTAAGQELGLGFSDITLAILPGNHFKTLCVFHLIIVLS